MYIPPTIVIVLLCLYIGLTSLHNFISPIQYDKNKLLADYGEVVVAQSTKECDRCNMKIAYGIVINPYDENKGIFVDFTKEKLVHIPHDKMRAMLVLIDQVYTESIKCYVKNNASVLFFYIHSIDRTYTLPVNIPRDGYCNTTTIVSYVKFLTMISDISYA